MASRTWKTRLDRTTGAVLRVVHYAFYNWTREMPVARRFVTILGMVLQGYAFWALWSRSLIWPIMWPGRPALYATVWVLYMLGYLAVNAMVTAEFLRKTQLESDEIAAQQIQRTLQPERIEQVAGYRLASFYKPFRAVGGDYFDVVDLPGNRTLFALADVSGKGMPAALLASNIQALVRSISQSEADPLVLAGRINSHLSRYTPSDRFATAVFLMLNRDNGELTYVNCGHNAPILSHSGSTTALEATGLPLGLFSGTTYEARVTAIAPGDVLLVFTDGLSDSVPGESPPDRLRAALTPEAESSLTGVVNLVDPALNEDDITILLIERSKESAQSEPAAHAVSGR